MVITIFGKKNCKYCTRAKNFLDSKNVTYDYIDILNLGYSGVIDFLNKEKDRLGIMDNHKTVPVIMVDNLVIGGFSELEKWLGRYQDSDIVLMDEDF